MRKSSILILLTAAKNIASAVASGNDAASMLQLEDKLPPGVRDAQRGTAKEATREASGGPAPPLAAVAIQSTAQRWGHEQSDNSMADLWASSYAEEELLEKEWMANSSDGGLGVMRMVPADDVERTVELSHTTIWIPAQPRSGSTLLMDMLSVPVTLRDKKENEIKSMRGKFVLFEPCHKGDLTRGVAWHKGEIEACGQMIDDIARCKFSHIAHLDGWDKAGHTPQPYNKRTASKACRFSKLVVFKSVYMPRDAWNFVRPRLEHAPSLRAVMNVRDPRAVLASQLRVFVPSRGIHNFDADLEKICQSYDSVSQVSHPRLLFVKFEDMLRNPWNTMKFMYEFLGLDFGMQQETWIKQHFGDGNRTNDCKDQNHNYTTCKRNVDNTINKWKMQLTQKDLRSWPSQACRRVSEYFNYT